MTSPRGGHTAPGAPAPSPARSPRERPGGAGRPRVTAVVVTYNNAGAIEECLRSVTEQLPADGSGVVVFDNASSDGTAGVVERRWPDVTLLRSPANIGFAAACNRAAARRPARFVLLVNPDATLRPGCVAALLDLAARRPEAGLYGGRCHTPGGDVDPRSCFGRPTLWGLACFAAGLSAVFPGSRWLNPDGIGGWPRDTERPVGAISGALLLADGEMWEHLGGFDERFFLYGEDVDLSVRASAAGGAPVITPRAGFTHAGGGSSSTLDKQVLLFRGKITLARALWTGPRRTAAELALLSGVGARAGLAGLLGARPRRSGGQTPWAAWRGLWRRRAEWRDGWPPDLTAR